MRLFLAVYSVLTLYFQADVFLGAATERLGCDALLAGQAYLLAANLTLAGLARKEPQALGFLLHLSLWNAFSGPFGTIVAAGVFEWSRAKYDFISWLRAQIESPQERRIHALRADLRHGRVRIEGASFVRPLNEIFVEGGVNEKLKALNILAKKYEPSLAPILYLASKDADAPVRVLASTVMGKLQAVASKSLSEKQAIAAGLDPTERSICLAEAHLRYEASGLLDDAQRRIELKAALLAAAEALRHLSASKAISSDFDEQYKWLTEAYETLDINDLKEHVYHLVSATRQAPLMGEKWNELPKKYRAAE